MNNLQSHKMGHHNPWNPFEPTKRDLERTEQLAQKNRAIAGIFAYILPVVAMIYLRRGVNSLKIIAYAFAAIIGIVMAYPEIEENTYDSIGETIGFATAVAITFEQVNSINKARERQKEAQIDDV